MTAPTARTTPGKLSDAGDLLALDRQVCFALAVASRTVIGLYRPLLEPMGLTHPQYLVMLALWEQEPLRVSELADRLSLEPATLSPLLKRLEASGLIVRGRDPLDDRALAVSLTPAGRRLRRRAVKIPPAIIERLRMEVSELEDIRDRLTTLIDAAQTGARTPTVHPRRERELGFVDDHVPATFHDDLAAAEIREWEGKT